jgi:hypothetical protein
VIAITEFCGNKCTAELGIKLAFLRNIQFHPNCTESEEILNRFKSKQKS